jgi:hypothetical protein
MNERETLATEGVRLRKEMATTQTQLDMLRGAQQLQKDVTGAVRASMNKAAAAVMFHKPSVAVSAKEAADAERADYDVIGDRPQSDKVCRAAIAAGVQTLAQWGLFPEGMADQIADVFNLLNTGAVEGFARPAPAKGRREGAPWLDQIAVAIADETAFQRGLLDISREAALTQVTGVKRPDAVREPPKDVAIPLRQGRKNRRSGREDHGPWRHARRLLDHGEKLLGGVRYAQAQGESARRKDGLEDPAYLAAREARLLLLKDPRARVWLFHRANDPSAIP